jgi:tRNA A-37 threonylcarbamoyl transferase component Bud32
MPGFPFQLLIKNISSGSRQESLICTAVLRAVPGRRNVYDALWNEKAVIVKIFFDKFSAKHHLKKEWQGLISLSERRLNTPKPWFYGRTQQGDWAIVMEKIVGSSTALEIFQKADNPENKLNLMLQIGRELARQHSEGVLQTDLHLGNFLLKGEKVFTTDSAQIRFYPSEIPPKKSLFRLAQLACWFSDDDINSIGKLCNEYADARGWHIGKSEELFIQRQMVIHRKRTIRERLKKILRTGRNAQRIKTAKYVAVFDKSFSEMIDTADFIKKIDEIMAKGQILKDGDTCFVSRVTFNEKDIVIKRYNYKGFIYSVRNTIKRSRARRNWLHANRLRMLDINTPAPLAYIERRKGVLVINSYFITEYVHGQNYHFFLKDNSITQQQHAKVDGQIAELFKRLEMYRIIHGDLKHSNILIAKDGPVLIDLDAMKVHKCKFIYNLRLAKDMNRLAKA